MGKAEQTRQMIIEKAAPIFNKKGYFGTSMSDLTESTGLTKGALYGNFENKDEIALAAFNYNINKIITELRSEINKAIEPADKLLAISNYYLMNYKKIYRNGGCPIVNAATDSDDTNPAILKKVNEIINSLKNIIIQIVKEGILKKKIISSVNPSQFASIIISLIQGGNLLSKTSGDMNYVVNSMKQIETLIMNIKNK
jgi:TetR/AcrR family transcriptional regulator, transcriptional repressor for nem operon